MTCTDEVQLTGQTEFSMTIVETAAKSVVPKPATTGQSGFLRPAELILSGSQVLGGFICALCGVGLFLWAVMKLWLFEI